MRPHLHQAGFNDPASEGAPGSHDVPAVRQGGGQGARPACPPEDETSADAGSNLRPGADEPNSTSCTISCLWCGDSGGMAEL